MTPELSSPEPIGAQHDVSLFSCGKPILDRWLKTRALANQNRGFTAVMVVHHAGRVVGYYGLAPTSISPELLPRSIRTGQPPDPVPCLLLGQLATDQNWVGKGIGTGLIGGRALIVQAVDDEARAFWVRRGFLPLRGDGSLLGRKIEDVAASLA